MSSRIDQCILEHIWTSEIQEVEEPDNSSKVEKRFEITGMQRPTQSPRYRPLKGLSIARNVGLPRIKTMSHAQAKR